MGWCGIGNMPSQRVGGIPEGGWHPRGWVASQRVGGISKSMQPEGYLDKTEKFHLQDELILKISHLVGQAVVYRYINSG